jgi:hypothetical protein
MVAAQWACIAAESEEILETLRAETERVKKEKMVGNQNAAEKQPDNELSDCSHDEHADKTATKAAKMFNTNREYISKAVKLKKESPEKFEQVKASLFDTI